MSSLLDEPKIRELLLFELNRVENSENFDEIAFHETVRSILCGDGTNSSLELYVNGLGFYPYWFSSHLLGHISRTRDSEETISWARKVLSATGADAQYVRVLWGVPVERSIRLTPTISIVPISDLPESDLKRRNAQSGRRETTTLDRFQLMPPQSALVAHIRIEPFLERADDSEAKAARGKLVGDISKQMDLITDALTIMGPRAPIALETSYVYDDPDFDEIIKGRTVAMSDIVPSLKIYQFPPLNEAEAQAVVKSFSELSVDDRNIMHIAMDRLGKAQIRQDDGDSAIELSIALESLLGDEDPHEMTHKIAVRAACLIGGSSEVRLQTYRVTKRIYDIRSKMVHRGCLTEKVKKSAPDVISSATRLCVDVCKKILQEKAIPDWLAFDLSKTSHDFPTMEKDSSQTLKRLLLDTSQG